MKENKRLIRSISTMNSLLNKLTSNRPELVYWVCKKKAAELYGVSTRTIYTWKKENKIQWKKINDKVYYSILPLTEITSK